MAKDNSSNEKDIKDPKDPKEKGELGEDEAEKDESSKPAAKRGKRFLLILIPLVLSVLVAGGYAAWRYYGAKKSESTPQPEDSQAVKNEYSYINLDDLIVTLSSSISNKSFLKVGLTLQIKNKETADKINAKLPLIKDSFQVFLRELRSSDLSGSAGVLMLKIELLKRVNKIVAPEEVLDILFKEILVS